LGRIFISKSPSKPKAVDFFEYQQLIFVAGVIISSSNKLHHYLKATASNFIGSVADDGAVLSITYKKLPCS
jgi:hypothetical protein